VDAEGMSPALLRVGPEVVRAQIAAVLTAWGMEPDAVATTAQVMVETDLAGVDSHGVSMLMDYDASAAGGS
jgi:LDH2 family malate/lactate/ureidoglycolate dehydrogenase